MRRWGLGVAAALTLAALGTWHVWPRSGNQPTLPDTRPTPPRMRTGAYVFPESTLGLPESLARAASLERRPFVLAYTGVMMSELVPCGCTTPAQGGLPRRTTVLEAIRERGTSVLALESGDSLFPRFDERVGMIVPHYLGKAKIMSKWFSDLGMTAMVLGEQDLAFGQMALREALQNSTTPIVGTNLKVPGIESIAYQLREVEGGAVAILSLVDPSLVVPSGIIGTDCVSDPVESLLAAQRECKGKAGLAVVACHVQRADLLQRMCDVAILPTIFIGHLPTTTSFSLRNGRSACINITKAKGTHFEAVELFLGRGATQFADLARLDAYAGASGGDESRRARLASMEETALRSQDWERSIWLRTLDVALDPSIPEQAQWLDACATVNAATPMTGALKHDDRRKWTDPDTCISCHRANYDQWLHTKHSHAFETLPPDKRTNVECLSCHIDGWGRFRQTSRRLEEIRDSIGCQSCHGPGEGHPTEKMFIPQSGVTCIRCHDDQRDPKFSFDERLLKATCSPRK